MPANVDSVLLRSFATLTQGQQSRAIRIVLVAELASKIKRLDEITDQMDMLAASGLTVGERTELLALKGRVDMIIECSLRVLGQFGADYDRHDY